MFLRANQPSHRTLLKILLGILPIVLTLSSCGNTSAPSAAKRLSPSVNQVSRSTETSPENLLQQASQTSGEQRYRYLFQAARAWQRDQCTKSLAITSRIAPIVDEQPLKSQIQLLQSECLWQSQQMSDGEVTDLLVTLEKVISTPELSERKLRLQAALFEQQQEWWQAAQKLAALPDSSLEHMVRIWDLLGKLNRSQLEEFSTSASLLTPSIELYLLLHQHAIDIPRLQNAYQQWQQRYPNHIFTTKAPSELTTILNASAFTPSKLGIILPLSGRLATQGAALKEGMLAAYYMQAEQRSIKVDQRQMPELVFIDSQNQADIQSQNYDELDFVIGPLLKQNVAAAEQYIQSPWLALNLPNDTAALSPLSPSITPEAQYTPDSDAFFFALSPEGEGQQLAYHLYKQGYEKPVVIQAESPAAQRMTKAFLDTWYGLNQGYAATVESVTFNDTKTMRQNIQKLLNVAQSQSRIKQIEAAIIPEVHAFERSRRDIDAIVIFANNAETEVITPFIEANTSPFADILPVYASSRSYSSTRSANSLRDLRNLMFVDMPWMLPDAKLTGLKARMAALWPKRQDNNQRLFAMGYDAYQLIEHLPAMQTISSYEFRGLTGHLSLSKNNTIRRLLDWGQVKDEKIVRVGKP